MFVIDDALILAFEAAAAEAATAAAAEAAATAAATEAATAAAAEAATTAASEAAAANAAQTGASTYGATYGTLSPAQADYLAASQASAGPGIAPGVQSAGSSPNIDFKAVDSIANNAANSAPSATTGFTGAGFKSPPATTNALYSLTGPSAAPGGITSLPTTTPPSAMGQWWNSLSPFEKGMAAFTGTTALSKLGMFGGGGGSYSPQPYSGPLSNYGLSPDFQGRVTDPTQFQYTPRRYAEGGIASVPSYAKGGNLSDAMQYYKMMTAQTDNISENRRAPSAGIDTGIYYDTDPDTQRLDALTAAQIRQAKINKRMGIQGQGMARPQAMGQVNLAAMGTKPRREEQYQDMSAAQGGIMQAYVGGGPVEDMSMSNVYDMQNARGGVSDMGIDNSTGMQRMAGGGITGSGELNLNIPLNFGGGGGGGFGGGFNQGPLDLGQNRTGFGQSAANGYQPVGSGALSSPPGFLAPKPSSTVGLTENPFNLGTQLASRLGSANQNPFAAQPTPEMMAAQRGESLVNPVISQISQADLQRLAEAGQARAYEQYLSGFGKNTPTYESQVAKASAGGQTLPISREKYEQQVANAVPMTRQEYDQRMKQANMGFAPLAHVLQPGTAQYDNYMKNRGPSNQFERFADGGMAGGGISSLGGYAAGGNPRLLKGPGDGMSDNIPAMIGNRQPARLADGEFVIPADVVSHLGNGSTDAGAKKLHQMMNNVRKARTGNPKQGKQINPNKYMPK